MRVRWGWFCHHQEVAFCWGNKRNMSLVFFYLLSSSPLFPFMCQPWVPLLWSHRRACGRSLLGIVLSPWHIKPTVGHWPMLGRQWASAALVFAVCPTPLALVALLSVAFRPIEHEDVESVNEITLIGSSATKKIGGVSTPALNTSLGNFSMTIFTSFQP